jgi:hypothetical protein
MIAATRHFLKRLRGDQDGVAMVEFAYSLIVIVPLVMGGIELANYVTTKMRVSQMALHVADNASRIGIDSLLAKPRITEAQINDLMIGADLQGGNLDLVTNGRVILSSVEPMPSPDDDKYMIRWQRCYGNMTWNSSFGVAGDDELDAVGPAGEQVKAPQDTGVMFVEIAYTYSPLFVTQTLFPDLTIRDTAAMVVRDDRDYEGPLEDGEHVGVYNTEGVTPSTCPQNQT